MALLSRLPRDMSAFNAGLKASKSRGGSSNESTLYSSDRLSRRLPFRFLRSVPAILYILVFWNLVCLAIGVEGVIYEFNSASNGVQLVFMLCFIPMMTAVWSCLDLHERRKRRLVPTRVVITASAALALLIVGIGVWTTCYFTISYELYSRCPNFGEYLWYISYGYPPVLDLAPTLPFLAFLDAIFYLFYFSLGLVALLRDREAERHQIEPYYIDGYTISDPTLPNSRHLSSKPSPDRVGKRKPQIKFWARRTTRTPKEQVISMPTQEELYAKYANSGPSSHAPSIEISTTEDSSQEPDSHIQPSSQHTSLYDSSVAEISVDTRSTLQYSSGASTSLVTPNSARSSALLSSSSSSWLPAYSGRSSATQSQRDSAEVQSLEEQLSRPQEAYLRY